MMNPDSITDFERWLLAQVRDAENMSVVKGLSAEEKRVRDEIMQRRRLTARYVKAALLTFGRACAIGGASNVSSKAHP